MPLLEAKQVCKTFVNENGTQLIANQDISLCVEQGESFAIVGESGSGKSTFAKMVTMLEPVTSGEIYFQGVGLSTLHGEAQRQMRQHIQMVFQDPGDAFHPRMKIKHIVCEPLRNFGMITKAQEREKAAELLEMVELPTSFLDKHPHSMSGGQRQRVGIARALAMHPELIILDEATSALDMCVQQKIVDLLQRIRKTHNITLLFICHDMGLVKSVADRVCVMQDARVVEVLPVSQLSSGNVQPYTQSLLDAMFPIDPRCACLLK